MKLTLENQYLSIKTLNSVDLPDFTLITGINGAGKTHLLEAIDRGNISVSSIESDGQSIRLFDWNNLMPGRANTADVASLSSERLAVLDYLQELRGNVCNALAEIAGKYKISVESRDPLDLLRLSEEQMEGLVSGPSETSNALNDVLAIKKDIRRHIQRDLRNNHPLELLAQHYDSDYVELISITAEHLSSLPFRWNNIDLFENSFAEMFLTYYELQNEQKIRLYDLTRGLAAVESSEFDDFLDTHGEPPWIFVNRIFAEAGLDFEVDKPSSYCLKRYTPQLFKKSTREPIDFEGLSSGERVLMSFAICLYYSKDSRQIVPRPKLLLLDEVDAPLHPSMSRKLIDIVKNTLVQDHDVKVIMTTHSPSTVAVAPEESIFAMCPNDGGLSKVSKQRAISLLTADLPTLSIDFSGRRQVFVESDSDANRYERLYQMLRDRIDSERSLSFIGVGRKEGSSETGSGCEQVKNLVKSLSSGGNRSVLGLIDWDGVNQSNGRIHVLAEGERDAIENCLLDPLLVAVAALREDRKLSVELGLNSEDTCLSLKNSELEVLQRVVDNVQTKVFEQLFKASKQPADVDSQISACMSERVSVKYLDGIILNIAMHYLEVDDHKLEEAVSKAFECFKRFNRKGQLLIHIIDPVMREFTEYIPCVLFDSLTRLLEEDLD